MERANSRHHIWYNKAEQELRPESRAIRQTPSFIPRLTRSDHDYIHEELALVPALGHNTLRAVSRIWTPQFETYKDIDGICLVIEQASQHPKSDRIETALAQLTIQALLLQKDLLKEIGYKSHER